jgi:formylglycine-generating enzyme
MRIRSDKVSRLHRLFLCLFGMRHLLRPTHLCYLLLLPFCLSPVSAQERMRLQLVGGAEREEGEIIDRSIKDAQGRQCAGLLVESDAGELSYQSTPKPTQIRRKPGRDLLFLSPGTRSVTVLKSERTSLTFSLSELGITLTSRQVWRIRITETRIVDTIAVIIYVTPADAVVELDGVRHAASHSILTTPGKHSLRVSRTGYKTETRVIEVSVSQVAFDCILAGNIAEDMVLIAGGVFAMGDSLGEEDELPLHPVSLRSFWIDRFEVTIGQYRVFCTATGRTFPAALTAEKNGQLPIVAVNWDDAVAYATWAGKRLPTEAEWEFAARGGQRTLGYKFSGADSLGVVGWYQTNADTRPHTVGSAQPNEQGLFDMSGNVWEWCSDWYADDYYEICAPESPSGPPSGEFRVIRGGSWASSPHFCRTRDRDWSGPAVWSLNIGFRCVRDAK